MVRLSNSDELGIISKMNNIDLEYFGIEMAKMFFVKLSELKFPALKYLMIRFEDHSEDQISLPQKNLIKLAKNSPNLRAIRFEGKPVILTAAFMFKMFETKGIIISVKDNFQEDLEMMDYFFKNQKDYQFYERYKELKIFHLKQF